MARVVSHNEPVTIVGGGITGLAAASFLVSSGHAPERITVIEKSDRWGGHARTLYLYKDGSGDVRIVSSYSIDLEDRERPLLRPSAPTPAFLSQFSTGAVELRDPRILPTDTAFCIFTPSYLNYTRLLSQKVSYPIIDTSLKSHIRRSYHLRNDVFLESYLPLFGLWRHPLRFLTQIPQLIHLKWQMKHFINAVDEDELTTMTVSELCSERGIDGTIFGDLMSAMVALYSGYTTAHLRRASARYFVDFLGITNMEGGFSGITTALLGNSLSVHALVHNLQAAGVKMVANTPYDDTTASGEPVLFAVHPWQVASLRDLRFESLPVPVYVNRSEWGHFGADTHYRHTPESSHATHDIDRYRPDYPDYGVQITFGVTGQDQAYEAKIRGDAAARGAPVEIVLVEDYRGEALDVHAVKIKWKHAYVTPEFERSRQEVRGRQGTDSHWYASASLLRSARHEDGVTSALDAVILMKGNEARKMLLGEGFLPGTTSAPGK